MSLTKLIHSKRLILQFPGQGSQRLGMCKDLVDHFPLARDLMKTANEALGFSISNVMFGDNIEMLNNTEYTQPALLVHSVIAYRVLEEAIEQPLLEFVDAMIGHSVGEYSSLVLSGRMIFTDALKLVHARGVAMNAAANLLADPSSLGMTALVRSVSHTLSIEEMEDELFKFQTSVNDICSEVSTLGHTVSIAAFNSPSQVVLSGNKGKITEAVKVLKRKFSSVKLAVPLQVSTAFHSPYMTPAISMLQDVFSDNIMKQPPTPAPIPMVMNVDASIQVDDLKSMKSKLLAGINNAVLWYPSMQTLRRRCPSSIFLELGSGNTLTNLLLKNKHMNEGKDVQSISISTLEDITKFK
jgi:[acyl-carrier-protein] S-malonyltransferase